MLKWRNLTIALFPYILVVYSAIPNRTNAQAQLATKLLRTEPSKPTSSDFPFIGNLTFVIVHNDTRHFRSYRLVALLSSLLCGEANNRAVLLYSVEI